MGNKLNRREFVQWTTPLLTAVALPVHAQCSEEFDPSAGPVVTADVKCVLNTTTGLFEGEMVIEIRSDGGAISINAIDVSGAGSDTIVIPDLPATATSTSAVTINWMGQSTDGITCLPLNNFQITITYGCSNVDTQTSTVNILDILV